MDINKTYTYLALGDSYTIGEGVSLSENFPYQLVQLLRSSGFASYAPEIIAKTGWTTGELMEAIYKYRLMPSYDFVTLLIGVNNQYRGYDIKEYGDEFEKLLHQAIQYAGGRRDHVAVISIPDWSVTPFAEGRDRPKIAGEIVLFNQMAEAIATRNEVAFIDITEESKEALTKPELTTTDGLHPSGSEYSKWSKKIFEFISSKL